MDSNPNQISCLGHDGPLRHRLLQCGLHKQKRRLRRIGKQRGTGEGGGLLDLVRPLAVCSLGRVDPCSCLAPEDADEAAHSVRLPARGLHDFGQRCTLGQLHHGDDLRLLVRAIGCGLRVVVDRSFALLKRLSLSWQASGPWWPSSASVQGCSRRPASRLFRLRFPLLFLLDRAAVVTIRHSGWGETQVNSGD